ncbi:MAG: o-succinylbenzoate synthase [Actinobacteria bacterium]|nr:o-succinylbenzoate synthase [Actinomycetota bacterium]
MRIETVELVRVAMPLVAPFRTSFGVQHSRDVLLVRVVGDDAEGWGECTTPDAPIYSSEYTDGAAAVLRDHLVPRLLAAGEVAAPEVGSVLGSVRGHRMAKAALELALLDAELRAAGSDLAASFGAVRDRVPAGVSVGIPEGGVPELLDVVAGHLDEGYLRVKLKIEPGFDLEPVAAVRERFGETVALSVDANTAYRLDDTPQLVQLDAFELSYVEQPFPPDHLMDHARLADVLTTPICLDESLVSPTATADAITAGACEIANLKIGRLGGFLAAVATHDVCVERGVPAWVGGMLETGIGRAANVALAALAGVTLPGDTSASDRYWATDLTEPFVLRGGHLLVPDGAGIGVAPLPDVLAEIETGREVLRA